MSCTRAREVDLAAFRVEPGSPELQSFLHHYPTCVDCSRELAAWGALESALREAGGGSVGGHPSEERLLAFQDAPETLEAPLRQTIERHLAGCPQCRSELAVLRSFDLASLAPRPEGAAPAAPSAGGLRAALARLAETLFGVPQPALALLLLLALALPAAWLSWRALGSRGVPDATPIAQRESPAPPALPERQPEPVAPEPSPELPRVVIAQRQPPEPAATEPEPEPVAVAVTPEPATRVVESAPLQPEPEPAPAAAPAPLRIAARLPDAPPRYVPEASLVGGSLDPIRVASVVRAGSGDLPRIRALGPAHRGATRDASPTLYWSLDAKSDVPVELTLVAEDGVEPLLELQVASPEAGIHALSLAERGVALEPGRPYRWFASLVPDTQRRDQDVVSGAGIVRAPADAALEQRLVEAPPERRAHLLAGSGYWYDAFATVEQWLAAEPDAPRLRAYRDALLRQAELDP